jgi:vitamin B12 transporter
VVVTATKFAIKKQHVGKIIYQIKSEEIAHLKGKSVSEVLDNIAGIHINGINSAAGKNKSAYVRGGRERQVLVLIDGVPVSDPSGINLTYDLRLLALSQVESIEVMNGAASTLYGSGAGTGVINIKLKESASRPFSLNVQTAVGTNNEQDNSTMELNDFNQHIAVNGTLQKFTYYASLNTSSIDGMSESSDKNSIMSFESDKYLATNAFVRMGYNFNKNLSMKLFSNYDKDVYDYDAGAFLDSDINNGENKQLRIGVSANYKYDNGNLKFIASNNNNDRTFDSFNSWSSETDHFEYTGTTYSVDVVNNYKFSDKIQLISGINYISQHNETNSPYDDIDKDLANYTTIDPYITAVYNASSGFNLNIGIRLNTHSEYGNHWVYNINPSYSVSANFKLISSYSTAFITPSTYQLFSQYGNVDLKPEEDNSIETGFVVSNQKGFELNAVFFYREEDSAIVLPDFIRYANSNETLNAKGIETDIKIKASKDLTLRFGHAYTTKSADVDYIPKNKFTLLAETNSLKNTYLSLLFKYISKRTYFDQWGTGSTIYLDAYNLIDLYGSHKIIKDRLSVFVQVNNIFDNDYEETIGYTTKGRNFKIGLNFTY